ncbi:MAG: AbrB/MazE/SpoVT family DNA-binding domain-containing protein [Candidatus Kapabacteria bacterium]|nr:AbrB/MazE/SpoVT family DNA-binding domain-containing protein [Candidatus Kapabacteria bacterium]
MEIQVIKWGDGLGLRIPQAIAKQINIKEGSKVNLVLKKNKIELIPAENEEYKLQDLLNSINDTNLHSEISFGEPQGKELW